MSLRVFWSRATVVGFPSLSSTHKLRKGFGFIQSHYTTMSAPSVGYEYIYRAEHLSDYRQGGYHPVHIYDRLNDRYRIVHKLGHGAFSTAWLAVDEKTAKYVAIKISTADSDSNEPDILSQITQSPLSCRTGEDKLSLLPMVLDRFQIRGPNGTHTCLVTLPARCSLRNARETSGGFLFKLEVARSLAGQLAVAVSLVHAAGYAHGGEHPFALYNDNSANPMLKIFISAIFSYSCPHLLMRFP